MNLYEAAGAYLVALLIVLAFYLDFRRDLHKTHERIRANIKESSKRTRANFQKTRVKIEKSGGETRAKMQKLSQMITKSHLATKGELIEMLESSK